MKQEMETRLGWLTELLENEEAPIPDKVDGLLVVLGEVRKKREQETKSVQALITQNQETMSVLSLPYNEAEERIKGDMWRILEEFSPDEKHNSDVGRAQIVRPKNRISYDTKGLETLRKSSDEVERMIGHLRKEKESTPYLKIKLK